MPMNNSVAEAYLVSGVRTPVGRYGGALAGVRPDDLAALVVGELVRRTGSTRRVNSVRSTRSSSAAPTRPAKTTGTSRAWRCCSPGFPMRCPASPSTGSAHLA